MWDIWFQVAFVCHFGGQDVFRLLKRDPYKNPLSALELAIFERAIFVHVQKEFEARAAVNPLGD